jgi:hypothetical protein
MPIAAFSSGDAIPYLYLAAAVKRALISSGLGGSGFRFGSTGFASSRKKPMKLGVRHSHGRRRC